MQVAREGAALGRMALSPAPDPSSLGQRDTGLPAPAAKHEAARLPAIPLLLLSLFPGCADASVVSTETKEAVTIVIVVPIQARLFPDDATVQVKLWNAEQLAAAKRNANCAAIRNPATGTQELRCPDGAKYQEVTPEEFRFPARDIAGSIEVRSDKHRVGERFRIRASGPSRDGCNTTSAEVEASADSRRVLLERLEWQTTARACAMSR